MNLEITGSKSKKCPRRGFIALTDGTGTYYRKTHCKTWRCEICRTVRIGLAKAIMIYGCSTFERLYLITVTLKRAGSQRIDAEYVGAAWTGFIRKFREATGLNLQWTKTIELTVEKIPHIHAIAGAEKMDGLDNCLRRDKRRNRRGSLDYTFRWLQERCDCYAHVASRIWYKITKGSFVVDVEKVRSSEGAVGYILKYVSKTWTKWGELEAMGFKRRVTYSRGWPREPALKLAGTVEGVGWYRTQRYEIGKVDSGLFGGMVRMDDSHPKMELTGGTELGDNIRAKVKKRKDIKRLGGILNGKIVA